MDEDTEPENSDDGSFDFMAVHLDESRIDPGDDNIAEETDQTEWVEEDLTQNEPATIEHEAVEVMISVRRSPEEPCLVREVLDPSTSAPGPHRGLWKRCHDAVLTKYHNVKDGDRRHFQTVPRITVERGETDTEDSAAESSSIRQRLHKISRQIKLSRQGRDHMHPHLFLEVPVTHEIFLPKSSLSGLNKRCHFENDISDDDIPVFDRQSPPVEEPVVRCGCLGRAVRSVVGAVRSLLTGFGECVWRCFGGEPDHDDPDRSRTGPRLEFSGLLESEDTRSSQPEKSEGNNAGVLGRATAGETRT